MFKSARWRSERSKVRIVFKLQFHAAKVPSVGEDALTVTVIPADAGKPSAKSDKSAVRDGSCLWENPVYETVKFNVDMKSGKFHRKMYNFIVATGSSKSGVIGEASLDLSNFIDSNDVTLVSLPLKSSKAEAVLNVSIQRMADSDDKREAEVGENVPSNYKGHSLKSQLSNEDADETKSNGHIISSPQAKGSSGSDLTVSSSGSSYGVEIPWQPEIKSNRFHRGPNGLTKSAVHEESCRSQWEWLGNSILETSTEDSLSTPRENFMRINLDEASDNMVEKLKAEVAALSRQTEMSELELQNLRKQITKENKRVQELSREVTSLKEERDMLRLECKNMRVLERQMDSVKGAGYEGDEFRTTVEELRQELNHEKELNSNLRIQLQKTQESNSELILAVQDLDEMLEQKNQDLVKLKDGSLEMQMDDKLCRLASMNNLDPGSDDKEQHIMSLQGELEITKRDKEEVEMQMEQLALDYEILKQENHEMVHRLQQIQLREQLKMQYECSSSCTLTQELESQIQKLEEKLKSQSSESEVASARVRELEGLIKTLEAEFEKQAQGFKADIEDAICCRVEQEQRALVAEEALRKTRLSNSNTATQLQEELRRLSLQMESTFQANEKLATKAIAEANELRLQKAYLEEMMKKGSEEAQLIKSQNEIRLEQLASQVSSLTNETKRLQSEIEDKELQLQDQQSNAGETKRLLMCEISLLKNENETHLGKIRHLCEEMDIKESMKNELEQMVAQMKEKDAVEADKTFELGNKIMQLETDSEKSQKELNQMRDLMDEKELIVANLHADVDSLQTQNIELKNSISENKLEKENLSKQVSQLKSELKKKEDTLISMEKRIKDGSGRDAVKVSPKSSSRSSKEVANLKDKIKSLQGDIKSKESALEMSTKSYMEKEKNLLCKIQQLERRIDVLSQNSITCSENGVEKVSSLVHDQDTTTEVRNAHQGSDAANRYSNSDEPLPEGAPTYVNKGHHDDEMAHLKEKNQMMEAELKEMQERYSEISLKFAEVEGERQQLVMKVRNLKNAHRAS